MTQWYRELRRSVRRNGKVEVIPHEDIGNYAGFISLYAFNKTVADEILKANSTRELREAELYSETLYVDFDYQLEAAKDFALKMGKYSYSMFDSGNRSYHFHVAIEPMHGISTPVMQRNWIRKNFPEADSSIYITSGIYRLPGTWHEKNQGHRKTLIKTNEGKKLKISYCEPIRVATPREVGNASHETLEIILGKLMNKDVHEGTTGRNLTAYKIFTILSDLNVSYDTALQQVAQWNNTHCHPPLTEQSMTSSAYSAYSR